MTKTMTLYHFVGLPVFNTFEVKEYTVTNQVKYFESVEWFQRFATKKENVVHNEMGRIEVFTTDAGMLEVLRKRFTSRLNREHSKLVSEEGVKQAEQFETTQAVEEEEAEETMSVYGREFTIELQGESVVVKWGNNSQATLSIENGRVNTSLMFYLMGDTMTRRSRSLLAKKINEFMETVEVVEETAAVDAKPSRNKFERVAKIQAFGRKYDVVQTENSIGEPHVNLRWEERGFVKTASFKRVDGELKRFQGTGNITERAEEVLLEQLNELFPAEVETEEIEMTNESTEPNFCPTCGERELNPVQVRNALSRIDSKTYVCTQCGTEEGLAPFMKMPLQFKRVGRYELALETMDNIVNGPGSPEEKELRLLDLTVRLKRTWLFADSWVERSVLERIDAVEVEQG